MLERKLLYQISILSKKNLIVTRRQWLFNIVRCLIAPSLLALFIAFAPKLFSPPLKLGLGELSKIPDLSVAFNSGKLVWADLTVPATSSPSSKAETVMSFVTEGFSAEQLSRVIRIDHADDLAAACPANFQQVSDCFGAVLFDSPFTSKPIHYTMLGNIGELLHVDVENHIGLIEQKLVPLQWAVDSALIRAAGGSGGSYIESPRYRAYTTLQKHEKLSRLQASYLRGINDITVIGLFAGLLGVVFHLAGSVMHENAESLTAYLDVMGAIPLARILSGYISMSGLHMLSWIIMAYFWQKKVFVCATLQLMLYIILVSGLSLASWSLTVVWLFVKTPSLAALGCSTIAMLMAMLGLSDSWSTFEAVLLVIVCPPSFFTLAIRSVCRWGLSFRVLNIWVPDSSGMTLYPVLVAALTSIFIQLSLAIFLDGWMSGRRELQRSWRNDPFRVSLDDAAIMISDLSVVHQTSTLFSRHSPPVVAAENFSLTIAKSGIHVLCGTNGSGKTSILECVCGLRAPTKGKVTYGRNESSRNSLPSLGVVPQKDVLWPELTVLQHLAVWNGIKSEGKDDCGAILIQCDLWEKRHRRAQFLSGGEKRKLQLAIALIGGSKTLIIDEVSSAVDPISRRLIQNTLLSVKNQRAILMTTHHLDEADILADTVVLVAPPGRILRIGSPAALKQEITDTNGYCLQLHASAQSQQRAHSLDGQLDALVTVKSLFSGAEIAGDDLLCLGTSDPSAVSRALRLLESRRTSAGPIPVDIRHSTLEDVFLAVTAEYGHDPAFVPNGSLARSHSGELLIPRSPNIHNRSPQSRPATLPRALSFKNSPIFALFQKRMILTRRQWSTTLFALVLAIAGSCFPVTFLSGRTTDCYLESKLGNRLPLFINKSPIFVKPPKTLYAFPVIDPPDSLSGLHIRHTNVSAYSTFMDTMVNGRGSFMFGGAQLTSPNDTLLMWEAGFLNPSGPTLLNIVSNYVAESLNVSSHDVPFVSPDFAVLPEAPYRALGASVKWMAFMGTAMSVYPVISAIYITKERMTGIKSMQLSNGFSPLSLWSGHLLAELPLITIIATVIPVSFARSGQFSNLGLLWLVLMLYGITGSLLAFVGSLLVDSPIIIFILIAMYQEATFLAYMASHLWTITQVFTFTGPSEVLTKLHTVIGAISPVASVIRASLLSANIYWEFCISGHFDPSSNVLAFNRFGGPILYLALQATALFSFLIAYDSGWFNELGSWVAQLRYFKNSRLTLDSAWSHELSETYGVTTPRNAALKVTGISKSYPMQQRRTLDNVSFSISNGIFALLGPNGAGKTTLFNIIQGHVSPDSSRSGGDVIVNGISMLKDPTAARRRLGVCLQANTLDENLTVDEHLNMYAICHSVDDRRIKEVLEATRLDAYRSRLAGTLSGGNKRKLCLAIALLGDPSVLLVDEWSSSVDPATKREIWSTLRDASRGRAVLMTTHSMEEADALADRVGVLDRCLLAVGTTSELLSRFQVYELQFSCQSHSTATRVQRVMTQRMLQWQEVDTTTLKYEYDHGGSETPNLYADLLDGIIASMKEEFGGYIPSFALKRISLENAFFRIVERGQHRVV